MTVKNTDVEIFREIPDDYYSPSLWHTEDRKDIGMNSGGKCAVRPIKDWVDLAWNQEASLTSAKAEGYQEGVKAMRDKIISELDNPEGLVKQYAYGQRVNRAYKNLTADQLLNSQGEKV